MIRFVADENFDRRIIRGLLRRLPEADILTVQELALNEASDDQILDWAAANDRVVITHDVNSMVGIAYERVRLGSAMSGVVAVGDKLGVGQAISDLTLIATCLDSADMRNQVLFLPL